MMRPYLVIIGLLIGQASARPLTVMLDPGHGGDENKGAPALMRPGTFEKKYALKLAHMIRNSLRSENVSVLLTREKDVELGLKERVLMANRTNADVFISLHLNSTEKPGPQGHATFFLAQEAADEATRKLVEFENRESKTLKTRLAEVPKDEHVGNILLDLTRHRAQQDSRRLAEIIQARMRMTSPFPDRGVKQAPFGVLKGTSMPAVVCEIGFLNHAKEGLYITSDDGLEEIAKAISLAILDYGELIHFSRNQGKDK
ncbi:MAG: N-acetylmuramoyl-L-alanine amidase [Myxococcota bacterium]|nr:N-acetylmuramoyl-L-alanine amidase [Myxococcota bacterium]